MTNEEALELLTEFAETTSRAVQVTVWAQAFLQEGGEPTWDAVKSVSHVAADLIPQAEQIAEFVNQYEEIIP